MIWAVLSFAGGLIVGSLWDTIFEPIRREIAKALTPFDLSVDQLADLAARGVIAEAEYIERLKGWASLISPSRQAL
jgi:hypothetical protein